MLDVLVFGRGELYRHKEETIKNTYNIIGYLDNSVNKNDKIVINGLPVHSPDGIDDLHNYTILIVSTHFVDMWKQLKSKGVPDERIIFGLMMNDLSTDIERDLYVDDAVIVSQNDLIVYRSERLGIDDTFSNEKELKRLLRAIYNRKHPEINVIKALPSKPVSRIQGLERGKAVDRYYIERFLECHRDDVRGVCMEVADDTYTRQFGDDRVEDVIITHVKGWGNRSIKADFETGEGIKENMSDCLICTQVLQYISDAKSAFKNIYRALKPKGVAFITLPGIKSLSLYDDENWGERWSFTKQSAIELCENIGDSISYSVETYGNVKVSTAYLYGLCVEELDKDDFLYNDPQYPFIIAIRLVKKA